MTLTEQLHQTILETKQSSVENVLVYPHDPVITGHFADIPHPGLFFINDFSRGVDLLDSQHSPIAAQLSKAEEKDILIGKLVRAEQVNLSIINTAWALESLVDNPEESVFIPILDGGLWYYRQLQNLLPHLLTADRFDSIKIKRTYGSSLGEIGIVKDFNESKIYGKSIWLVEDLGDEHLTLRASIDRAIRLGASDVQVIMLANKLGVTGKLNIPEIKIVGLGVSGHHWIGGAGSDFQDDLGRELPEIWVKKLRQEWQKLGLLK